MVLAVEIIVSVIVKDVIVNGTVAVTGENVIVIGEEIGTVKDVIVVNVIVVNVSVVNVNEVIVSVVIVNGVNVSVVNVSVVNVSVVNVSVVNVNAENVTVAIGLIETGTPHPLTPNL